jgi:transposase, IS5 family
MLRIHLLQQWYSLSDPAMEEALIEVPTIRRFAGIDLISDQIPDETTILSFLHLLEKQKLGEQIFEMVKANQERGASRCGRALSSIPPRSLRPAPPRTKRASAIRSCTRRRSATNGVTR